MNYDEDLNHLKSLLLYAVAMAAVLCFIFGLVGCANRRPTCYDNPRNMSCMTAEQLEKELNQ